MLESLKAAWSRWKVHVSVAGGILVIATAYGTCTYEPPASEPVSSAPAAAATTSGTNKTVEVSATSGQSNVTTSATATPTTTEATE